MIYDRPYMSQEFDQRSKSTLIWLIWINVGIFLLQHILSAVFEAAWIYADFFVLRNDSILSGKLWTILSYSFLHDTRGILHIFFNMLILFFLGRVLLPTLGQKPFLQLYLGSALMGGLVWWFASFFSGAPGVVGASGAVSGLLVAFACMFAESEILFMFVIRMKAKVLAWILLGISFIGFLYELKGTSPDGGPSGMTAHSAHLGGMLGGYLFFKFIWQPSAKYGKSGVSLNIPSWLKRKKQKPRSTPSKYNYKVNISQQPKDLKKEVDRILDKINSKGFGSLTAAEKEILDKAGDLLKRR